MLTHGSENVARPAAVAAALLLAVAGCNGLPTPLAEPSDGPLAADAAAIPLDYEVVFEGIEDDDMGRLMRESSLLYTLRDRPPDTRSGLRWRVREDVERELRVLRSRGFYAGTVEPAIEWSATPPRVRLRVEPGVVYLLGDYEIAFTGESPPPTLVPDLDEIGLHLGMVADAATVEDAQQRLVDHLHDAGRPFARVADRRAEVSHDETLLRVRVRVDAGPAVAFGAVRFDGLESADPDYLRRLVPWTHGAAFAASTLGDYRRRLMDTGLFASVAADPAPQPDADGTTPVVLTVREAEHNAIGGGLDYSTSNGFGVKALWEFGNIGGAGESLRLAAAASRIEQTFDVSAEVPDFIVRNQALKGGVTGQRVNSRAFEETGVTARAGLERRTPPHWRTGLFTAFEYAGVEDSGGRETVRLFGLPIEMTRDTTDSVLDPTEGSRVALFATPYLGRSANTLAFASGRVEASLYRAIDDERRFVLAGRTRAGTVLGEDRLDLPANKRFFAGGGGSIRGYAFQSVGPIDDNGDPEGGRSILELGGELRVRIDESFGVVPFIDGGTVYDGALPDPDTKLQWSAGLGVRYFTAFAPLRLDVAFPINRRREPQDDVFEVYVSIGQAF